MKTSELEMIMAYHDGELPLGQRIEVELWLDTRPEARAYLEELQAADRHYRQGFAALFAQETGVRLADQLAALPASSKAEGSTGKRVSFPFQWSSWQGWALAASLTLMLTLGAGWWMQYPSGGGQPGFAQALDRALESTPSGEVYRSAEGAVNIMPLASYSTDQQGHCREYAGRYESRQVFGLACREASGRWASVLQAINNTSPAADADIYVPASGPEDKVAKKLDALGAHQALTTEQEAQLIAEQWR